jgi:hypothetical protein
MATTASYMAACTIPSNTSALAGGRLAMTIFSAIALQSVMAF